MYRSNEDDNSKNEPFLACGYGVNAYFDILESLSKMFLVISLFTLPVFLIYGTGGFYSGEGGGLNPINRFFIGNFGATTMFAKSNRFTARHMEIVCPKGLILDGRNAEFGIMSNQFESFITCHKDSVDEVIEQKGYIDCT